MIDKRAVKRILGELPFTAELYWRFVMRGRPLNKKISLKQLERRLPGWKLQVTDSVWHNRLGNGQPRDIRPKNILIFATLRYWIEHTTLLSMALAGMGHKVTLAYLPYPNFRRPFGRFDLRRVNAYVDSVLEQAHPAIRTVSLLNLRPASRAAMTPELLRSLQEVAERDTQYSLQVETIDREGGSPSARLYRLRLERDLQAAAAALGLIESMAPAERPELLITPNGSILEMGAVYQAARSLHIPIVTYEFGEQRGRIWFAQDSEVMLQETDALWDAHRDRPLDEGQWEQIKALYASRQNGRLWENFSRLWQELPNQGGDQVRQKLGLDNRPVALLAANVIGDSLTLGRQIFSHDMTEWLQRTVQFFADRPDVQLLVRIHPGERYLKGPSVAQVVKDALPEQPRHICLIQAQDPVNTYDLVEIADLGLVYTTTVGMEMAMSGVPVIAGGQTHYRGKGFTIDPETWDGYYAALNRALAAAAESAAQPERQAAAHAHRLSRAQVELAWKYAYHFFFDYPTAFPWHLINLWDDVEKWPLERVLADEGQLEFGNTFRWLAGEPRKLNPDPKI